MSGAEPATEAEISLTAESMEKWQNEELHDDLVPYVNESSFLRILQHPLVFDIGVSLPGLVNLRYQQKLTLLETAIANGNIEQVVFLHERPYRLEAMLEYAIEDDGSIWKQTPRVQELAESVWTDSENIHQHQEEWLWLYRDRPEGAVLGDKPGFRKLPDQVTVYRGGGDDSFLSWSTKRSVAEFFAKRFAQHGGEVSEVRSVTVDKADIFAYYTGRSEYEVLTFVGMGI